MQILAESQNPENLNHQLSVNPKFNPEMINPEVITPENLSNPKIENPKENLKVQNLSDQLSVSTLSDKEEKFSKTMQNTEACTPIMQNTNFLKNETSTPITSKTKISKFNKIVPPPLPPTLQTMTAPH